MGVGLRPHETSWSWWFGISWRTPSWSGVEDRHGGQTVRRQQRLRRHDAIPLNPTSRRTPRLDDPMMAACHDALFVVNRIAGVVHRLEGTPEATPRRTLCGWHFGDVRLQLPHIRRVHSVLSGSSAPWQARNRPRRKTITVPGRPNSNCAWMPLLLLLLELLVGPSIA